MDSILTATIGAKGQITLPKDVREILGILGPGGLVGFVVDRKNRKVSLAKLKIVAETEDDFSEEEYRKLLALPQETGGKTYSSLKSLIKNLK